MIQLMLPELSRKGVFLSPSGFERSTEADPGPAEKRSKLSMRTQSRMDVPRNCQVIERLVGLIAFHHLPRPQRKIFGAQRQNYWFSEVDATEQGQPAYDRSHSFLLKECRKPIHSWIKGWTARDIAIVGERFVGDTVRPSRSGNERTRSETCEEGWELSCRGINDG